MSSINFMVGSSWIYYKVYCGPTTAETILVNVIAPLVLDFKNKKLIEKWFFIRYADPKPHLRIRFKLSRTKNISYLIRKLHGSLEPLIVQNIIWKVQLDTYQREINRYGENTIDASESIFCFDSEATLSFLGLIEGEEGEKLRWLYGIRAIDNLLNAFEYRLPEKLELLRTLKDQFGKEFGMQRSLKKQIDSKYRLHRVDLSEFMTLSKKDKSDYKPIFELLDNAKSNIRPLVSKIALVGMEVQKENLIHSYIHMLMNRTFKSKNRLNEMVCYDYLYRYYDSLRFIKNGE